MTRASPPDPLRNRDVAARLLDADAAAALGASWDALAAAALEENAFLARPYVLAGLGTIDRKAGLRALAVFRVEGRSERLIGLWPLRRTLFRYGWPLAVGRSSLNAFQTSGAPLVHRDHAAEAVDALLGAIVDGAPARRVLVEQVRGDGPVAALIRARAAAFRLDAGFTPALSRPVLRPEGESAEAHFRTHLAPKRLRDLVRMHRRLEELGRLDYLRVTEPAELADAIETFARMEAAGWKGRAGTAYDASPATASYLRASFGATIAGKPIAYADLLTLDGRAIAANLNLQTGRTVFALKTTYDESYRRYAPGLVLEYRVIRHLFETRFADEIDSCVTEDGHVISSLWPGAVEVGTLTLQPAAGPRRPDLARMESRRRTAHRAAKRAYLAMRGRGTDIGGELARTARRCASGCTAILQRYVGAAVEKLPVHVTVLETAALTL